ncbi:MAG: HEAT repeat domain-containing protein [Desulfosarcina sp.]|jgi:hypothetical protein
MKFRDIFLPKIVRSDPNVRKKAVLEESNLDVLKKVIQNDSDKEVRQAARKRLQRINSMSPQ